MREPFVVTGYDFSRIAAPAPTDPDESSRDDLDLARSDVEIALAQIPAIERDVYELSRDGKDQYDIGTILGMSQAAVSYRLTRSKQRIRWILTKPPTPDSLVDDLYAAARPMTKIRRFGGRGAKSRALDPHDIVTLTLFYLASTSIQETARMMSLTHSRTYHIVDRLLEVLGSGPTHALITHTRRSKGILHGPKYTERSTHPGAVRAREQAKAQAQARSTSQTYTTNRTPSPI